MLRPFLQCDDCLWDRFYLRLLTAATICSMLLLQCCYRWLGLRLESLLLKELYRLEFVALHHALNLLKEIYEIPLLAEGPQLCLGLAQLLCQAQCTVKGQIQAKQQRPLHHFTSCKLLRFLFAGLEQNSAAFLVHSLQRDRDIRQ